MMRASSLLTAGILSVCCLTQVVLNASAAYGVQSRSNRNSDVGSQGSSQDSENESADSNRTARPKGRTGPKKTPANVLIGQVLESTNGIQLYAPRKLEMQFGMNFNSNDNYCSAIRATIPFPMNWPEQKVEILNHEIPENMLWEFRDLPAGARQLVMQMKSMPPSSDLNMVVHVQIEKSFINAPEDTSIFKIPKSTPAELQWYMGSSPYIDVNNSEIKRTVRAIAESKPVNAWAHVEMLYDWVRSNIEYTNGPVKHIKDALKDRTGDCEEMTSIFVALCRASKIPARCVWIPDHCYPEFYLEDDQGNGHWFPCQVAGERQFGQMHDYRPILQKGDRFKIPEEKALQRYVATFFKCNRRLTVPGGRDVEIEEILDLGALKKEMDDLRRDAALGGQNSTNPLSETDDSTEQEEMDSDANGDLAPDSDLEMEAEEPGDDEADSDDSFDDEDEIAAESGSEANKPKPSSNPFRN